MSAPHTEKELETFGAWIIRFAPLFLTLATLIWSAGSITAEVSRLTKEVEKLREAQYTKADAMKDATHIEARYLELSARVATLETNNRRGQK